jgi:hypothetical protein
MLTHQKFATDEANAVQACCGEAELGVGGDPADVARKLAHAVNAFRAELG